MRIIFVPIIILFSLQIFCQDKVKGKPEDFERPKYYEVLDYYNSYVNTERDKKKNTIWRVYADRPGVDIHKEAVFTSPIEGTLDYKTQEYLVVDEDQSWIRVGKAISGSGLKDGTKINKDDFEILGWVEKEKMLLWTQGMTNVKTGIHAKAFLLNKLKDFDAKNLKEAYLYDSPVSESPIGTLPLYEYYYIYDVYINPKTGQREKFLLGREASFRGVKNINKIIVGWVNSNRVTPWNTRLALEPNFKPEAFKERKKFREFRVQGFKAKQHAQLFYKNGISKAKNVLWDSDPSLDKMSGRLGKSNSARFKGAAQRFPSLNFIKTADCNIYRSGVIAGIRDIINGEDKTVALEELKEDYKGLEQINVLLVLEGSETLEPYKRNVINIINKLKIQLPNGKFGVSVYRDLRESNVKDQFDISSLSLNVEKSKSFINDITFSGKDDFDDWTTMYHGFSNSIIKAGFDKNQTNVLIHIGSSGDISNHPGRRRQLKKDQSLQDEFGLNRDLIRNKVSEYNLNIVHLQVDNRNGKASLAFQGDVANLMTNLTKEIYVKEKLKEIANCPVPFIPDFNSSNNIEVENFLTVYSFLKPSTNAVLDGSKLEAYVDLKINKIIAIKNKKLENVNKLLKGELTYDPSMGEFTESVAQILTGIARKFGYESKKEIDDFIKSIGGDKKFYHEVFFIGDKLKGARHEPFSFVLLYPKKDLENYIEDIRKLLNAAFVEGLDTRRESLKEYLINLAVQFTDEQITSKADNISLKEIAEYMQGISGEGYNVFDDGGLDFKIEDITNRKKFKDEQFDAFINRLEKKLESLEAIVLKAQKGQYEFSFKNGNYFWIPLDQVF